MSVGKKLIPIESDDGSIIPYFYEKDIPSEWVDRYFTQDRSGDIVQILYTTSSESNVHSKVKAIIPFYLPAKTLRPPEPVILPHTILSKAVWKHVWKDDEEPFRFNGKYDSIQALLFTGGRKMNDIEYIKLMRDYYYETPILNAIRNIWNGCCLLEGSSSLPRETFVLWLSRLHCVMYDLFDDPLIDSNHYKWVSRQHFIKVFVLQQTDTQYLEYFKKIKPGSDISRTRHLRKN